MQMGDVKDMDDYHYIQNWSKMAITKDKDTSAEEKRSLHFGWKSMTSNQKISYVHKELLVIIFTLKINKTLCQFKMNKVLNLRLTLYQALRLKYPNYLAFIMDLIRKKTNNANRNYLNSMRDLIDMYHNQLLKQFQKQVEEFRKLDKEDESDESQELKRSEQREENKSNIHVKDDRVQRIEKTYASGQKVTMEERRNTSNPNHTFFFTRTTRQ